MKNVVKMGAALVALLAIAGCTTFQLSGIQVVEDMPGMQPLGDFEIIVPVNEFIGAPGGANLFNASATAMNNPIRDAIRREIENRSGDAAINVTVEYRASFVNILLNGLTLGIWSPAQAIVTGTVVSYN